VNDETLQEMQTNEATKSKQAPQEVVLEFSNPFVCCVLVTSGW
jgi:hypothetical protein